MSFEFKWDAQAEEHLKKMALQNMEGPIRQAVESVECPDHHEHPQLVREGDELRIAGCCTKVAEMAADAAGIGPVTWQQLPK